MYKRVISTLLILLCLSACDRDPNVAKKKYVESGNKYFEKGKYKEALIMYRNALKRDPKYGEAYYRASLADLKLQRWTEAARDLQRAVELQPQNLDAHTRLVNLYLNAYLADQKRPKAAILELQSLSDKISARFPKSYDEYRLKGYLALFNKQGPEALEHLARANKIKPHQQDLVLVYMQSLAISGRGPEAEALAKEMIASNPSALPVYDSLFIYYMQNNRPADAEQLMKLQVEKNPKNASVYLKLAGHYLSTQQRDNMMATLNRLTANKTDFPDAELMVGDFFLRIRELDLALQHYQTGMNQNSKDKHTYQKRMVEVLVKQNKKDEANQLVAEILKEDPKDHEAIAIRASLALLTGTKEQLQSAINDLQTVISRMPENPVLRYNLGRALLAKGNVQAARVQFEEAVKLRPDYLLPRITLAQLMLQNNEYGKVIQMSQEILVYDSANLPARLLRSRALIGLGDTKQAREELVQTSAQFPDLPEARLQIAALDLQDKNYKGAEDSFRRLYNEFKDPRAFIGLIETHVSQGQPEVALKLLREEIARNPERMEYRVAVANISANMRDYPTAINEYKFVLSKLPRSSDVWLRLGEAYRRSGDTQQAAASYKKAQELAPTNVNSYVRLAMLYDESGRNMDAKPLYEKVLSLQPDNGVALNNLAYMLAESGSNLDEALSMAQKAKQQMPNDVNVSDTLGWIYIKKNLSDSAINIFRELIQKQPDRSTYHYHLAMALYQKGDKAEAKKACEQALLKKPPKQEEAQIRELMSKLG